MIRDISSESFPLSNRRSTSVCLPLSASPTTAILYFFSSCSGSQALVPLALVAPLPLPVFWLAHALVSAFQDCPQDFRKFLVNAKEKTPSCSILIGHDTVRLLYLNGHHMIQRERIALFVKHRTGVIPFLGNEISFFPFESMVSSRRAMTSAAVTPLAYARIALSICLGFNSSRSSK